MRKHKVIGVENLDTILMQEVLSEGAKPYDKLLKKLKHATPGTEQYRSLLCELSVQANVMKVKSKVAEKVIQEYLDSLD